MVVSLSSKPLSRWSLGVVAALFLALFAAYPQIKLLYNQGGDWQGHYAYNDIDEVAYAAYLKALIDGRPRKNDPYTGRDDSPGSPQPESLFSIQFAAPYAVALPARVAGISAPAAMTISGMIAGFLAALFLFRLVWKMTGSPWAGLAGSLAVLCGGALAAGEGAVGEILGLGYSYPYFPFLRRYLPAVPFAAFAGLLLCVWLWLNSDSSRRRVVLCVIASLLFSFTVFSYFYIWTSAAAWLACLGLGILIARPEGWRRDISGLTIFAAVSAVPVAFYALMLGKRSETLDQVQLLVFTREPDLARFPVYLGFAALVIIGAGIAARKVDFRDRAVIFTLAFAVTPFVLFNQQIITGRSLQPIHYQVFIGNYIAALGLVLSIATVFRNSLGSGAIAAKAACSSIATLAIVWGFVECHYTVRVLDDANMARDGHMPAAKLLREEASGVGDPFRTTIFSVSNIHADDSPTVSPQAVLWSRHQHVFPGLSWQESKERYYKQLYFQGLDDRWMEARLKNGDFVSMIALFGWGRHSDRLTAASAPLTGTEIEEEAANFRKYIENFDHDTATEPLLTHAVVPAGWTVRLENLEKWYELGPGTVAGNQVIYRLRPR